MRIVTNRLGQPPAHRERNPAIDGVRSRRKAGFTIARQGEQIAITYGLRIVTIPRHNPVNSFTKGGIARDTGLSVGQFRELPYRDTHNYRSAGPGRGAGIEVASGLFCYAKIREGVVWMLAIFSRSDEESIPPHALRPVKEEIDG